MIKRIIHGAPFRHPLHPAMVHLPIGLFSLSALFDLGYLLINGMEWGAQAAAYTIAGGVLTGLLAAIPGLVDWSDIRIDHSSKRTATIHMLLNITAVVLFGANYFIRTSQLQQTGMNFFPPILTLLGLALIFISGYLGGKLVYDEGIGVGRYRRLTDLPDKTLREKVKDKNEFVAVADKRKIGEGDTLRVEINGEVIAIACFEGEYYAFNEFCTHRFGPLSEGAIQDHQIECPWHRSCFDIRSGKVTEGPAKIDIKTYEVKIKDEKIFVRSNTKSQ